MKIKWYGQGCFLINGSKANILLDPFVEKKEDLEKIGGDVILAPSDSKKFEHSLIFDWPGEYETKGVGIISLGLKDKDDKEVNTFILELDRMRICHIGPMNRELTNDEISLLGDVDVLFLPIGGENVLDIKAAHKVIDDVDARMVIPMYYNDGQIEDFKKEMGLKEDVENLDSVDVKGLTDEQVKIVFLNKTV